MARFIVNYEKNREMIIEEIERNKLGFAKIDKSLSVEVQLELPEVSNAYQLDIKEENSLNVGTLHFGDAIIKLVSSNDIIVVDRREAQSKVKEKQ